jgi:hypothetical protein
VVAGNPARVICSLKEFLLRHEEGRTKGRVFRNEDYGVDVMTAAKEREMAEYLERQPGYMEG